MCVPEISFFFIIVRSYSRLICSVFISIFNISALFCSFSLLSQTRVYIVISRGGRRRQRLTTIPSVLFFLHLSLPLRLYRLLLFLSLLLPEICLPVCLYVREKENERDHPTCITRAQPRAKINKQARATQKP